MFPFRAAARKYAHICDCNDAKTLARLQTVLGKLGGTIVYHEESEFGIARWDYRIGRNSLDVFADPYSIDVEGSAKTVDQILDLLQSTES